MKTNVYATRRPRRSKNAFCVFESSVWCVAPNFSITSESEWPTNANGTSVNATSSRRKYWTINLRKKHSIRRSGRHVKMLRLVSLLCDRRGWWRTFPIIFAVGSGKCMILALRWTNFHQPPRVAPSWCCREWPRRAPNSPRWSNSERCSRQWHPTNAKR